MHRRRPRLFGGAKNWEKRKTHDFSHWIPAFGWRSSSNYSWNELDWILRLFDAMPVAFQIVSILSAKRRKKEMNKFFKSESEREKNALRLDHCVVWVGLFFLWMFHLITFVHDNGSHTSHVTAQPDLVHRMKGIECERLDREAKEIRDRQH